MEKDKYELAKELLKDRYYNFDFFDDLQKKQWESYNVPKELVKEWVKEYLNKLEKEVYDLLLLEEEELYKNNNEKLVNLLIDFSIIMYKTFDFEINYYKQIISLLKKIDAKITLGKALLVINPWDRLMLSIDLFLSDKEKEKYYLELISKYYYYDTDEKYFGLLPYLYKKKEYQLFNELFELLYKYLEEYKELKQWKWFDVSSVFIEYAKYVNMDYEKYLNRESLVLNKV